MEFRVRFRVRVRGGGNIDPPLTKANTATKYIIVLQNSGAEATLTVFTLRCPLEGL